MERGEGMYLWDTEGKRYLDFVGGWAVNSLGHSPAVLHEALSRQSSLLVHASPSFYNKPMLEFSRLLTDISCFDKVFFTSTGSEANESAVKLARKYGALKLDGAYEIITMTGSFHGRTLAMMSATGKPHWKQLFEPKVPGFRHVPLNDIDALFAAIHSGTCAIMLELVQGEGGVHEANESYLYAIRKACDMYGLLLIADEVQTGLGRTGSMFAYERYGIEPDIMTLGKGIGGGFPLSAMLAKQELDLFDAGDQGGTYTGQPLGMAAGLAVVQEIITRNLPEHAAKQGEYLTGQLRSLAVKHQLHHIRGKGLLLAFDLPSGLSSDKLVALCRDNGLLINAPQPSSIRLMPPLVVTAAEIDEMIGMLDHALTALSVHA
ncbi:acetylornithine/succinylornithine family transaminase [Paenibacillus protaetiae]|uniref:Acetylornithine/succinylornithine family transaminase n=2 Tax=Paenibacillus protaetiae TaxID=2509456 RepID=A0A4P6FD15_9BACL|nr:acetylornithine/succinylornithine family transaminase [Paenibacillus protaetiae]